MPLVLRIMTCFLVFSFCSIHSMENVDEDDEQKEYFGWSLKESKERYDRLIYEAGGKFQENVLEGWDTGHIRELTKQIVSFCEYNRKKKKNERKKVISFLLMGDAGEFCTSTIMGFRKLQYDPGVGYRFFKAAKKLLPHYKPSESSRFKLMGGKRCRTVGHGNQIEFFGTVGCRASTAIRYSSGSKEDTINKQFKRSKEEYTSLKGSIKLASKEWKEKRTNALCAKI